jgi:hypothetical protein
MHMLVIYFMSSISTVVSWLLLVELFTVVSWLILVVLYGSELVITGCTIYGSGCYWLYW